MNSWKIRKELSRIVNIQIGYSHANPVDSSHIGLELYHWAKGLDTMFFKASVLDRIEEFKYAVSVYERERMECSGDYSKPDKLRDELVKWEWKSYENK